MRKMITGSCALLMTIGIISIANSWQQEGTAIVSGGTNSVTAGIGLQDPVRSSSGYTVMGQGFTGTYSYAPLGTDVTNALQKLKEAETSSDSAAAEKELREALEKDYDSRLSAYESNLDQLEEKLKEMRKQLDRRRDAKDDMVSLRLQVLKAEADDLGWPSQMPGVVNGVNANSSFYGPAKVYGTRSTGGNR